MEVAENDSFEIYIRDVDELDRLTREDEICLSQQIEFGSIARDILSDPTASAALSESAVQLLALDSLWGLQAHKRLVEGNLSLVIFFALESQVKGGVPAQDLIQAGNISLMNAASNYDWRQDTKFSWFARSYILGAIKKEMRKSRYVTDVPEDVSRRIANLQNEQSKIPEADMSNAELCDRLGVTLDELDN